MTDHAGAGYIVAPVRWMGGKGRFLPNLFPLVPQGGEPYAEPYAGAASLFWAREPAPVEALNDLDGDLVALFRVLQDPARFQEFRHRAHFTPYARAEFARALDILQGRVAPTSDVDRAWALFVAHNQGFCGKRPTTVGNWGRGFMVNGGIGAQQNAWLKRLSMLDAYHWRLMRTFIDNRDAIDFIKYWDNKDAVFYVDPPYVSGTRISRAIYASEASDDHHEELVEVLLNASGAVVLSGYDHEIYRPLADAGWQKLTFDVVCSAIGRTRALMAKPGRLAEVQARREVVWRNPAAVARAPVNAQQGVDGGDGKCGDTLSDLPLFSF